MRRFKVLDDDIDQPTYQSDNDEQNIIDAKQKMRTGSAPSGNPGQEAPLEQPWYSPDELAAGMVAPGVQRGIGTAARYVAPEIKAASIAARNALAEGPLGNEVGAIGRNLKDFIINKEGKKIPVPDYVHQPKFITAADKEIGKSEFKSEAAKKLEGAYEPSLSPEPPVDSAERIAQRELKRANEKAKYAAGADKRASLNAERLNARNAAKAKRMELSSDIPEGVTPNIDNEQTLGASMDAANKALGNSLSNGEDWLTALNKLPKINGEAFNKILATKDAYMRNLQNSTMRKEILKRMK